MAPLVYATRSALEAAAKVLPDGVVLESEVARLIVAGRVKISRRHGVVSGDGWAASVCRTTPRLRTKPHPRPWLVTAVDTTPDKEKHDDANPIH